MREYTCKGIRFLSHVKWWKAYSQQIKRPHEDSTQHLSQPHSSDPDPLQNVQTKRIPAWEVWSYCQVGRALKVWMGFLIYKRRPSFGDSEFPWVPSDPKWNSINHCHLHMMSGMQMAQLRALDTWIVLLWNQDRKIENPKHEVEKIFLLIDDLFQLWSFTSGYFILWGMKGQGWSQIRKAPLKSSTCVPVRETRTNSSDGNSSLTTALSTRKHYFLSYLLASGQQGLCSFPNE